MQVFHKVVSTARNISRDSLISSSAAIGAAWYSSEAAAAARAYISPFISDGIEAASPYVDSVASSFGFRGATQAAMAIADPVFIHVGLAATTAVIVAHASKAAWNKRLVIAMVAKFIAKLGYIAAMIYKLIRNIL